jgi:hypothetical protein
LQLWERELAYRKEAERRAKDLEILDAYLVEQIKEQKQRLQEDYLDSTGKLEKGKAYPDFRRLKRLAKRYGVYKDAEGRFVQVSGGVVVWWCGGVVALGLRGVRLGEETVQHNGVVEGLQTRWWWWWWCGVLCTTVTW